MNKRRLIGFVLAFVIVIIFVNGVMAQDSLYKKLTDKGFWKEKFELTGKLFGTKQANESDKIFGMQISSLGAWHLGYFFIGLVAGLILWVIYSVKAIFKWWFDTALGIFISKKRKKDELSSYESRWLKIIAGNIWKVPLIGVGYWVVMNIPFFNRVVQVITLDLFLDSSFLKIIVLALELGALPPIAERYWQTKVEIAYAKAVAHDAKVQASVPRE